MCLTIFTKYINFVGIFIRSRGRIVLLLMIAEHCHRRARGSLHAVGGAMSERDSLLVAANFHDSITPTEADQDKVLLVHAAMQTQKMGGAR